MGSISQNHFIGRRESHFRPRARSMPLHKGMSSLRDSRTLGRSEQCCESTFLRNSAIGTANLDARARPPTNCRNNYYSNIKFRTSGHFHDTVLVHDGHAEASPRVVNCGQASVPFCSVSRGAIQSACNCGGHRHGPERCEEQEAKAVEENRCYHRGPSVSDAQAEHGHSPAGDDCGVCCLRRPSTHSGRDEGGYKFDDRMRGTGGSPCFPVSEECTRRVLSNGFNTKPSQASRKSTTIASRTDSTSNGNVLVPTQASKEQVFIYGWFLKTSTGNCTPASSTLPQVAVGGYKSAGLLEADYCEFGPIVHRLERWRLRTSDGVDVGLMGIINVSKSVENGFPLGLAQCFMIGFPSTWIFLISNFYTVASKRCNPDLPSSSSSPNNANAKTQDTTEDGRKVPLTTLSLEVDPVHIILSSSLFNSPDDSRVRSLRRVSITNNASVHSGIVSDATSVPQSLNPEEDLDKTRNDTDSCYGAINSGYFSGPNEMKAPVSSENTLTERVLPERGGENPASLVDGLAGNDNPAVLKEESSRKGGFVAPNTSLNEQAQSNIDLGEFLGDGKSGGQEGEGRITASDEVLILQDVGVVMESISQQRTCASDSNLKPTCPPGGQVDLDGAGTSAGNNRDGESNADLLRRDSSDEELSNRGDEIAKQAAPVSEDTSDTTRKRPFQELNQDEPERQTNLIICSTNSLSGNSPKCTTWEKTTGVRADTPPPDRSDVGLTHHSIPCTPLQESKKRSRCASGTETPSVDQEVRDDDACDENDSEPVLDTGGADEVEGDKNTTVLLTAEDLTAAESKDCKRPKLSESLRIVSAQFNEESIDIQVEPIIETGANAGEEILVATKDLVITETKACKRPRKLRNNADFFGQPKISAEEYREVKPTSDASGDVLNGESTISPKISDLPASSMRRKRRRAEIRSPSRQSGEEFNSAAGVAETGDICLVETRKESYTVLKSEVVANAEDLLKGEVTDAPSPSKKFHRRPRVRYYTGRRKKRRVRVTEKGSLEISECKTTGGEKCFEHGDDQEDHPCEKSKGESPAPVQEKQQHKASSKYCTNRRRKSHGEDSRISADGPGAAADRESQRDPEEREHLTPFSRRLRKNARRFSCPVINLSPKKESKPRRPSFIKSWSSMVPPPPPSPRVVDKTMVPEAFGLKTSRHGRVLVPPLAAWLNQSIKYDMDGSIIAITEGFQGGEEEFGSGRKGFKPPSDKDAVSMRKKLREAAELVAKGKSRKS